MKAEDHLADRSTIRENKLSLVERLADDLAHEIKNPLHSMVINLEVLRRRLARLEQNGGEDLLRYAGVLSSELERVNRRVDLLLRMVRPTRDSDEPTTLAEVLDELHELVELECERREVKCVIEPPQVLTRARLPRASTRQMVLSLILETLDSIPPGGTLVASAEVGDGHIRLRITGSTADGAAVTPRVGREHDNYLAVVRALAEELGGALERDDAAAVPAAPSIGYVLTLPRDGPRRGVAGTSPAPAG